MVQITTGLFWPAAKQERKNQYMYNPINCVQAYFEALFSSSSVSTFCDYQIKLVIVEVN